MSECHCGKDGHALNSIHCPVHGYEIISRKDVKDRHAEFRYAARLAQYLWETHWKENAPDWKPLPDMMGVLTQIDNMVANLKKAKRT